MKNAFTLIEVILAIVIVSILVLIAAPKLVATKDDAKAVAAAKSLSTCITDIGAIYTTNEEENLSSDACQKVLEDNCFVILLGNADGNINVVHNSSSEQEWCLTAKTIATNNSLIGVHSFGGTRIVQ